MSLKLNAVFLLLMFVIGCVCGYQFRPEPVASAPSVEAASKAGVKVIRVTEPSGKVTESLECAASSEAKATLLPATSSPKSRYSVFAQGLTGVDAVGADARLGDLPLFVGGIASKDNFKLSLRWEF